PSEISTLSLHDALPIYQDLLDVAQLLPYEKVQVVNVNNGSRLETYTIPGPRGSRVVCLNGPAARLHAVGDRIIVISYAQLTPEEDRKSTRLNSSHVKIS